MELFARLFGGLLLFVYHCFDRVVIHGYLSGVVPAGAGRLLLPGSSGGAAITKEVLSQRMNDYQSWVEAYARNQQIPLEGGTGTQPAEGSLSQKRQRLPGGGRSPGLASRRRPPDAKVIGERLEYWTLVLGPKFSRRERAAINLRRFYAVRQVEYCRNLVFKRHFPIHRLFERSCELGLWRLTAHKISEIFGTRVTRRLRGKLHTTLEQVDHGHHIFRAYWKNGFLKQYEKFSTFLRNELCSNNLADLGLKKGLDHLAAVRQKFGQITDRFAAFQALTLNVHVDFPLLQRLALSVTVGSARFPGIKIQDTRLIRLMEVLLHGGTRLVGWPARQIHPALLNAYALAPSRYGLNQLRYDLRKLRAHGLLQRDGRHYAYHLTDKGVKVAVLFVLFHQRLCGPLAHSLFQHRPDRTLVPNTQLEAAFHKADYSIRQIIELLEAA